MKRLKILSICLLCIVALMTIATAVPVQAGTHGTLLFAGCCMLAVIPMLRNSARLALNEKKKSATLVDIYQHKTGKYVLNENLFKGSSSVLKFCKRYMLKTIYFQGLSSGKNYELSYALSNRSYGAAVA